MVSDFLVELDGQDLSYFTGSKILFRGESVFH